MKDHLHLPPEDRPATVGVDAQTWGIIYCPTEGSKKNWMRIQNYLDEKQVKYDFVQSEGAGSVERLAALLTKNGYRTIIVVGGDAAVNYALNGMINTPSPTGSLPALGIIPNGYINDFAKYWNFERKNYKNTIDRLIKNRRRRIDVGVATALSAEQQGTTEHPSENAEKPVQYFINCLNIGAVASIVNIKRKTRRFFVISIISYLFSAILLLFQRMSFKLEFSTPGEFFSSRAMTLCVGSAHGFGQTPSAVPYNGQLDISLVTTPPITQLFHGLWLLFSGRFLSHKGIRVWRTRQIEFHTLNNAPISLDGRMMHKKVDHLKVEIMEEALEFLI